MSMGRARSHEGARQTSALAMVLDIADHEVPQLRSKAVNDKESVLVPSETEKTLICKIPVTGLPTGRCYFSAASICAAKPLLPGRASNLCSFASMEDLTWNIVF